MTMERRLAITLISLVVTSCGSRDPDPMADVGSTSSVDGSTASDAPTAEADDASDAADTTTGDGSDEDTGPSGESPCTPPPGRDDDPLAEWTPPALEPTHVVTTLADDGPGSLREVLAAAPPDAIVGFDARLAGGTIALQSTLVATASVTLDGSDAPGLTLDGQGSTGILRLGTDTPTTLRVYGLRFVGGTVDGSGAAISLNGGALEVEIAGCHFENNASGEGGAIRVGYAKGTDVWIHHSTFVGNDGSRPGDNNGFSGGAISAIGTNLTVDHCRFENNIGPTVGALYTIHSDPVVEDSVFVGNSTSRTDGGAGGFFVDGGGPGDDNAPGTIPGRVIVRRCLFEGNTGAGADGGGLMIWGYSLDEITIEDTIVRDNRCEGAAKGGGAKLHARNRLRIVRTAFVDNHSAVQGGGIWVDGEGPFELENVLFDGNIAEADRGGGATFAVAGRVDMSFVTFADNAAGQGAAAFWLNSKDNDVHLRDSIVAFNTAANAWELQVGHPPIDEGGNLEWPEPGDNGSRVAASGILSDPRLEALAFEDGTWVRPLQSGSPAIGAATADGTATTDVRGAPRNDGAPDIGAYERSATCNP